MGGTYENSMDELAQNHGFLDRHELNKLTASVDISTDGRLVNFELWKENDGSKAGLLLVIEQNKKPQPSFTEFVTVSAVTVTPEVKRRLMDEHGLTEADFIQPPE